MAIDEEFNKVIARIRLDLEEILSLPEVFYPESKRYLIGNSKAVSFMRQYFPRFSLVDLDEFLEKGLLTGYGKCQDDFGANVTVFKKDELLLLPINFPDYFKNPLLY